jgi:nucleoid DNA-binding protein
LDISIYIRDLILLNECVILRGVGGFETSYKNASFKKNKKSILPPSKHIHFRPDMIVDNGVLEDYIRKTAGITKEEAARLIDGFVKDFYKQLKTKGSVILKGIGEFSFDIYNKLQFQELGDVNYLADSFGLDTLEILPATTILEEHAEKKLTPVIPQKRKLTGWYVAIGILILVISVTLVILIAQSADIHIFNLADNKQDQEKQDIVVFGPQLPAKTDSLTLAIDETISKKTTPKNALAIQNENPVSKPVMNVVTTNTNAGFLLIAGSFKNSRNAEVMKNELLSEGFKPEVLYTGGNYYRVVIGKFNDRQEAVDELRRIRKQINQSVWLWERN